MLSEYGKGQKMKEALLDYNQLIRTRKKLSKSFSDKEKNELKNCKTYNELKNKSRKINENS